MSEFENIFSSGESIQMEIEFEEKKIPITIRQLTWSEKNQILSRCFVYNSDGLVNFNFDRYQKEVLGKMIQQAPWGETNHIFLNRIKPEFGAKLEKLVPKAFEEGQSPDFFVRE